MRAGPEIGTLLPDVSNKFETPAEREAGTGAKPCSFAVSD